MVESMTKSFFKAPSLNMPYEGLGKVYDGSKSQIYHDCLFQDLTFVDMNGNTFLDIAELTFIFQKLGHNFETKHLVVTFSFYFLIWANLS